MSCNNASDLQRHCCKTSAIQDTARNSIRGGRNEPVRQIASNFEQLGDEIASGYRICGDRKPAVAAGNIEWGLCSGRLKKERDLLWQ
jgi:hypothetical protein